MKKQLQITLASILFICLISPSIALGQLISGLEGSGTKADPVQIKTSSDLKTLSNYVNTGKATIGKYFLQVNDIDFSGESLDYDLNGDGTNESNFKSIGDGSAQNNVFRGSFDGNNKIISGLKIKSTYAYVGLFGFVLGDIANYNEIKNISLTNSEIEGAGVIGSLMAYAQYCNVKGCKSQVSIKSNTPNSTIGGIIGYSYGSEFENCISKCNITSSKHGTTIGGFIGASGNLCKFNSCYTNIEISSTGDTVIIGGFAGSTHSPINNCYSSGEITSNAIKDVNTHMIGGFVSWIISGGNISNCYSITKIPTEGYFGGFAPYISSASANNIYYDVAYWNSDLEIEIGSYKNTSEMKETSFVDLLNSNQDPAVWASDSDNRNNGFPILEFQKSSLNNVHSKNDINITYNNNTLNISGKNLKSLNISDIHGRIILNKKISGNNYETQLNITNGIYIVTINSVLSTKSTKIIITK